MQLGLVGRIFDVSGVPEGLTRTDVIVAAAVMYAIEFVTDKIPYVDNAWDAIHTVIRPTIGVVIGLLLSGDADTLVQAAAGATGGLTALTSHLTKASTRLALNLSPEPFTNITASIGEDAAVGAVITVMVVAPWAAAGLVAVLVVIGGFVVWRLHRRLRRAIATVRARFAG